MKLGLSTYSLYGAIQSGELTVADAIDWMAGQGCEHVEIVPVGFDIRTPGLIDEIVSRAAAAGLEISNYAVGANFAVDDDEAYEAEIARVKDEVDIARALGVKKMRHDVASRQGASVGQFWRELPRLADACRRIAEYAASVGVVTSVENHGYYMQSSERVLGLLAETDHPNFRLTLDIGNYMCLDEDPAAAVKRSIGEASIVHLKDFYLRRGDQDPGEGWFKTASGNYLRGAIFGQGDIDVREVLRIVKASGYDGYLSLEFEGLEECKQGSRIGLANARRIWDEV